MARQLLVMRHGKSSWADSALADVDRPLAKRGKRDAQEMGRLLAEKGLVPDLIVVSPAKRARGTVKRLAEACAYGGKVLVEPRLYATGADAVLEVVGALPDQAKRVLLVGHNPALEGFVAMLTGDAVVIPTAAVAVLSVSTESWRKLPLAPRCQLVCLLAPSSPKETST